MLGKKTKALMEMEKAGFRVPALLGIPSAEVEALFDGKAISKEKLKKLADKVRSDLPCESYAVRSSALIEDSESESFAGQFKTILNQKPEEMEKAIKEVVMQAHSYLKGEIKKFSLIVQEFVDADFSGVAFSRSPLGGREMVVEYHMGIGEKLVSGEIRPEKRSFYWNQGETDLGNLPLSDKLIDGVKKIEALFGFPQDIEWCIKNDELFFLQSRPITTMSREQYESHLFLDSVLPRKKDFLYAETEVSEAAPRPCTFTLSLLRELYKQGSAVDNVYKKHGISYIADDFIKIIGNELYIDREKEIKTLLPSYSYLGRRDFSPHVDGLKGTLRTVKNFWRMNQISLIDYPLLRERVKNGLRVKLDENLSFEERLEYFEKEYELVFEINLLVGKVVKLLEETLKSEDVSIPLVLVCSFDGEYEEVLSFKGTGLLGNGLDIADEDPFLATEMMEIKDEHVKKWYQKLSDMQRRLYLPRILQAQKFNRLREYARWLTVRNINYLRRALPKIKNIYFASVEELKAKTVAPKKCDERKKEYEAYNGYDFASRLSSKPLVSLEKIQGVSAGKARGPLTTIDKIKKGDILYTTVLSPELTREFDKLAGIASSQGGLLSHLAIIARENKLPVVVGFDFDSSDIQIGDIVEIDGEKGKIKKIE